MTQNIEFDYTLLRRKIINVVGSNKEMAKRLGVTEVSFSRKMNNKTSFSLEEIVAMAEILDIEDFKSYFFMPVSETR